MFEQHDILFEVHAGDSWKMIENFQTNKINHFNKSFDFTKIHKWMFIEKSPHILCPFKSPDNAANQLVDGRFSKHHTAIKSQQIYPASIQNGKSIGQNKYLL